MKRTQDYLNEIARQSDIFYELSSEEREEMKQTLLEMFIDVKRACDNNNIEVIVAGGTCLGTIRHKGFIPWDDDMDLMMSRENYDKLISVFEKELSDKYELSVPRTKNDSIALSMRIIKKNPERADTDFKYDIDIFPIERLPDNKILRSIKCKYLNVLRVCVNSVTMVERKDFYRKTMVNHRVYYYIRYMIGLFFSIFGRKKLMDYFDRVASCSKGNQYWTIATGRGMSNKECHPTEVYFPPRKGMFEGVEVLVPHNVDAYLSRLYGNYMEIPPIEKRERHFRLKE